MLGVQDPGGTLWPLVLAYLVVHLVLGLYAAAGVGLHLAVTALRQPAKEQPTCDACRYNLTGLTAERCPECGTGIGGVGERLSAPPRFAPRRFAAGVAMLLAAAAALALLLALPPV